jgi:hypothetical protein
MMTLRSLPDLVVAAVLLQAGLAKLVAPQPLRRALAELLGGKVRLGVAPVRGLAAVEVATGAALLVPAAAPAGRAVAALLGAGFVAAGVLGLRRGSAEPCGCFGGGARHPLGATNVAVGLAVLAAVALAAGVGSAPGTGADETIATGATALLALCLWVNRRQMADLLGRRAAPRGVR